MIYIIVNSVICNLSIQVFSQHTSASRIEVLVARKTTIALIQSSVGNSRHEAVSFLLHVTLGRNLQAQLQPILYTFSYYHTILFSGLKSVSIFFFSRALADTVFFFIGAQVIQTLFFDWDSIRMFFQFCNSIRMQPRSSPTLILKIARLSPALVFSRKSTWFANILEALMVYISGFQLV